LNQNNDEIRASGGFPGSAIYVELYKGAIRSWGKKDIYEYDWNLYPYKELPPAGLALISPNHGLRDANYFPEFEKNAQKMNFFIEKAGFDSIDTFIAINQKLVNSFLQEYGPVYFKEINETISAQNFSLVFSTLVEAKVFLDSESTDWKKTPKSILFTFMDVLFAHLLEKKDFGGYAQIVERALQDREIQIASLDSQVEDFLKKQGAVDPWLTNKGNWIYPVFTSVSGNKSDRYIDRTITITSKPQLGCKMQNKLSLDMLHTFGDEQQNQLNALYERFDISKKQRTSLNQIE